MGRLFLLTLRRRAALKASVWYWFLHKTSIIEFQTRLIWKYALLLGSIPSEIEDQVTRTVGQSVFETHIGSLYHFCFYYILNKPGKLPAPQLLYRPPVGQVLSRFPSKKDFKNIWKKILHVKMIFSVRNTGKELKENIGTRKYEDAGRLNFFNLLKTIF